MKSHPFRGMLAGAALAAATASGAAAQTCDGKACTIVGTAGADTIFGSDGADVICALGGSDTIYGGSGGDTICAGAGNDQIYGDSGPDLIRICLPARPVIKRVQVGSSGWRAGSGLRRMAVRRERGSRFFW